MSSSPNPTTLDLHGRRLEEAISDVTLFLERIRRTVAAASRGRRTHQILYVKIITGAGSHSTHGPVLRNAVHKLLEKRGMDFRLERGGGAFQVDALSGVDFYDVGPAVCSKVLVSEQEEFHQMAMANRRNNNAGSSFAHAATAVSQSSRPPPPRPPRTVSVPTTSTPYYAYNHSRSDPLPAQVASNDAEVRTAVEASVSEVQKQRSNQARITAECERQYQRAVSESQLDHAASSRRPEETESKEEEALRLAYERSLADEEHRRRLAESQGSDSNDHVSKEEEALKLAYEQSLADEQNRQQLTEKQFEDALMLAIEQSANEKHKTREGDGQLTEQEYEDALMLAIEQSAQEAQNNTAEAPDDEVMQQILAESRALAEAEKANSGEDDLLEKVLAESMLEEERRRKALGDINLSDEAHGKSTEEEKMLAEVVRLSLAQQQEEAMAEEDAIRNAMEMSKQIR